MKKKWIFLGAAAALAAAATYAVTPTVHKGQPGEAPELGRFGPYQIGTVVAPLTLQGRGRISGQSAITGKLDAVERSLNVRFWYPSGGGSEGQPTRYEHFMQLPGKPPFPVSSQGVAIADDTPMKGKKFPLVLMSHGYGGWNTQFSNLAEHIASRGYVVASIDHADMPADSISSFLISFGNVMLNRALDQRQVLAQIAEDTRTHKAPYLDLIDLKHIGLIGYSMGGYGAINTAGAAYLFDEGPLAKLPKAAQEALRKAAAQPVPIQALVAFSPWGGQPESRAWDEASLAEVKLPVMIVVGNQDDVVNFKDGVSWLFKSMTATERHMLVYREARHNIVGNPFEMKDSDPFMAAEFLKEPVWRSDRLNAINQHFVTAFLDLTLKGQADKRSYLDVPTVYSDQGEWPMSFAEQLNGMQAGPEQAKYWRGFQRRWATGLEMHRAGPGKQN